MVWEKSGELAPLMEAGRASLRIPGEREASWVLLRRGVPYVLTPPSIPLLAFRMQCFMRLKVLETSIEIQRETLHTVRSVLLSDREKVGQKSIDTLIWYLSKWSKLVDPATPDAAAPSVDDLQEQYEKNKALFDQALKISTA